MMNVYMGTDVEDFIFGESTSFDARPEISDEEMNQFGVIECFDDPDVACYRIALENEQNHNAIMMAIAEQEVSYIEEGIGETLSGIKDKIKDVAATVKKQIMRFWAKVKGVFKKVMDMLSSLALSNKQFIKKYQPVASQIQTPKNGGDFEIVQIKNTTIKYADAASGLINSDKDFQKLFLNANVGGGEYGSMSNKAVMYKKRKVLSEFRRDLLGATGDGIGADKWDEEIKGHLYEDGGKKVKAKSVAPAFSKVLTDMEDNAMEKKYAKDAYKEAEKSIKEYLRKVKEYETPSNLTEEKDAREYQKRVRYMADMISSALSVMSSALSYQTKAITTRAQNYRKIANWYVRGQKMEGFKESTVMSIADIELV